MITCLYPECQEDILFGGSREEAECRVLQFDGKHSAVCGHCNSLCKWSRRNCPFTYHVTPDGRRRRLAAVDRVVTLNDDGSITIDTDEKRSALNRTFVVAQITVYWCLPVFVAALLPKRFERGLSDEQGVKLLEELSLWAIVGDVLVRPLVQFVKALVCTVLIMCATDRSVRPKSFASHMIRDMLEGDREGLLNIGWLISWRNLKDLREEVKLNPEVPLIVIGAMEFWLPPSASNVPTDLNMVDLTWVYEDEDNPPTEERLGDSSC